MTTIPSTQTRQSLQTNDGRDAAARTPGEGFDFGERNASAESPPGDRHLVAEAIHALRRRWLLTTTVGLIVGSLVAVCAWFGTSRLYTATAILRISTGRSTVLNASDHGEALATFDIFKRTQRQYIRSPRILTSVLQRAEVAAKLKNGPSDPLSWLQQIVIIAYPDDAEIMQVSVRTDDRELSETVANAIVDVYLEDANDTERQQKIRHMGDLESAFLDGEKSLRTKRLAIRDYADAMHTGDNDGLTPQQKNDMQEYMSAWTQLNQINFELIKSKSILNMSGETPSSNTANSGNSANAAASAEEDIKTTSDPVVMNLTSQLEHLQAAIDEAKHLYADKAALFKDFSDEQQPRIDRLKEKISNRRIAVQKEIAARLKMAQQTNTKILNSSIASLTEQKKHLTERTDALKKEVDKIARPSVDVELMRAEVKAMEEIQNYIQRELHEAKVEVANSKPRTSLLSHAVTPQSDATKNHLEFCGLTGAGGFFASGALVIAWDLRRRRLNSAAEVARLLRLKLLGTVPPLFARNDAVADQAMDAIAATIAFSTPEEFHRLLMVTSAAPGEGKTTVAAGLAMSLARMGRPTVLVDFDLRCPLLHEMFGLDLTPGIADVLAERIEPTDAARPTSLENLSVVPAGQWNQRGFADWCNDRLKRIFAELRLNYAHVVIDTAPLLPSVETRLLVPHVDGIVISLLRDVSEISRIRTGCELLQSCDASVLGAVMVGAPSERYERRKTAVMQVVEISAGGEVQESRTREENLGESKLSEATVGEENVVEASQESGLQR
jgi:polysaccharide biosynthesis transport protein